ncbi:uncharacterized protein LOC128682538 isoform X2 [Plodia interpunctella]|uniref:uncharacterized protein LOC128682538 isoform X2 n=1 Tax=Plodia interpunctella TaxID=58824 RepID=UPI002367BFF4|nr:uncharacterized protein LOC128682538 isoform X2 [Plodia interpunctella]
MNVREEERQKNACPNRGLGLAAAAIGVGVGAALYYFFSKRTENPNGEGSTSVWNTEQTHAFVAQDRVTTIRDQAFRERSWSLEECSICFDVILKNQQVTTLPCTHHFHSDCIAPWLQEQQTCPNCRKSAE